MRVIPYHDAWLKSVMREVMSLNARLVFVSSHNEAVLLRRQKQTWCGRVWVLGHLAPGEVMAEVGRDRISEELFSAPSFAQIYYFLLEKIAHFYQTRYKCSLPIQEVRDIAQTFIMLFMGNQDATFFANLTVGYGKKCKAYEHVFAFLHTCVRETSMDFVHHQTVLQESILASDLTESPAVIAVSQPLNDSGYAFVDACKERFKHMSVVLYGEVPRALCVYDAHFFVKRIMGNCTVPDTPSHYAPVCEGYACERYSDEVECVVALAKAYSAKGVVVITSRQLIFLRSVMYRMRAEAVSHWNGLGEFFWDMPDGRRILRCADFLSCHVTAVTLHTVLGDLIPEYVLHDLDKKCLRQEVFSQKKCEYFLRETHPEFLEIVQCVFDSRARFQKAKNGKGKIAILDGLVRKKAFSVPDLEDIWTEFCTSKHMDLLRGHHTFTSVLKSMILGSVVHKRVEENIVFVHPNDARILGGDTVIYAGFYDAARTLIVEESDLPQEVLGLRSHLTHAKDLLDFLGCLSHKNVLCTWHKTGQGGQVHSVSHLWFYAQKKTICQEHEYTRDIPVYVPCETQEASVTVPGSCLPQVLSATQIARLFQNPYDFYMRTILGLEVLPALGDDTARRQEGLFVHAVLALAHRDLRACLRSARTLYPQFFVTHDEARFGRLLHVIADLHGAIDGVSPQVFTEHAGRMTLALSPERALVMRADRIDVWDDFVRIGDFKTGSKEALKALFSEIPVGWQLAVEGLIAYNGGIEGVSQVASCQLCVWHAQGRGAQTFSLTLDAQQAKEIQALLVQRLAAFYGQGSVTFALPEGVKSFYTPS